MVITIRYGDFGINAIGIGNLWSLPKSMQSLVIVKGQYNCQLLHLLLTALVIKNINATYSSRLLMLKFNSEIFLLTGKVRSYVSLWFHENTNNCNKIGILHYWRQRRDSYKMEELYFVRRHFSLRVESTHITANKTGTRKIPKQSVLSSRVGSPLNSLLSWKERGIFVVKCSCNVDFKSTDN